VDDNLLSARAELEALSGNVVASESEALMRLQQLSTKAGRYRGGGDERAEAGQAEMRAPA
jgi:hypothetical protein